jgi:heme oxygenase
VAKLRHETRAAHESIERSPRLAAIFSPAFSINDYRELLHRLQQFYAPLEDALFSKLGGDDRALLMHRRKSEWLEQDLRALGEALKSRKSDVTLPALLSDAHRFGAFYVLEGATLGGKIIRKRLAGHLGAAVETALRFYGGYGAKAGAEWSSFRTLLSARFDRAGTAAQDAVVEGAQATFAAMEQWMAAGEIAPLSCRAGA